MQEAMKEANLPEPEFHTEGMFTAVFKRQIKNYATDDIVNNTANKKEQEALSLLKKQAGLNATEIAQRLGKSIPTFKFFV